MPTQVEVLLPPGPEPSVERDSGALVAAAAKALGLRPNDVVEVRIRRVSFDARRRARAWRVAVEVWTVDDSVPQPARFAPPLIAPSRPGAPRVVVVGSGPAGLFAALDLLAAGFRVTLLERGGDVRARRRPIAVLNRTGVVDPDSNYCYGAGGAGTFSDGKLYTRTGNKREVAAILELLVAHGAPAEILVSWRPHIGSNRLPEVVAALGASIERAGGGIRFMTRATAIEAEAGRVRGVRVVTAAADGDVVASEQSIECDAVVLATGHSALDAVSMAAAAGARLEAKGFAMGVRVEHPQRWLDRHQYGGLRETHDLPAAFYELKTHVDGRGVYSFCMCPGGFIVPATTARDRVVVNGMSLSRRDSPYANSGIVVALSPEDWCGDVGRAYGWQELLRAAASDRRLPETSDADPLFGVELQMALERLAAQAGGGHGRAPAQRVDRFVASDGRPTEPLASSYRPGLTAADLATILPLGMVERLRRGLAVFERSIPGFVSADGQLVAIESRTSSPVRVLRDAKTCESPTVGGLFPCAEGAGYAGGIVSAALDGRRIAAAIAARVRR